MQLLGFVANPLPYLAGADATLLLSRSPGEGRPLTAVESAATGTPVLGLAGSPALRWLAEEDRARLVDGSEPAAVARAVKQLVLEPRRPLPTPSWDDTARAFVDTLNAARPAG